MGMENTNKSKLSETPSKALGRFWRDENDEVPPPATEIDLSEIKGAARNALVAGGVLLGAGALSPADALEVSSREPQTMEETIASDEARQKAIQCLTENVYHEARGEIDKGKLAVAFVTLARTLFKGFPSDVCGVVYQPKQFSWTFDENILAKPIDKVRFEKIRSMLIKRLKGQNIPEAVAMLSELLDLPIDTIYYKRAGFQGSRAVQNFFTNKLQRVGDVIDHHEFFIVKK